MPPAFSGWLNIVASERIREMLLYSFPAKINIPIPISVERATHVLIARLCAFHGV